MYYLNITGKGHRRLCKDAISWFMEHYLPKHIIELSLVHRGLLCEGVYGWCTVEDCDYRPRSFLIEIHNQLDVENYLNTLFHELWHVYQFVKGDLRDKRSKRYWKGSLINDVDYEDDPSEIEAHSMEKILTQEYLVDNSTKTK